jgi:hypothetical protein
MGIEHSSNGNKTMLTIAFFKSCKKLSHYTLESVCSRSNIVVGGSDGDFALVILIVDTSDSSRSIVTSIFDNSATLDLSSSMVPSSSVRGGTFGRGTTPTLLPRDE